MIVRCLRFMVGYSVFSVGFVALLPGYALAWLGERIMDREDRW